MRIRGVTTAVVEANYDWTIVRVESDEGVLGWGEAFCAPGLPETIRELAPLIEGRDADIQKVGGLADTRRIAALADVHSRPLAPHNIAGPIGTLASAHVCASIPNFLALEWHAASVPFFDELLTTGGPVIEDGYITVPDRPGNGAELDLDVARRYARPGAPFFDEPA